MAPEHDSNMLVSAVALLGAAVVAVPLFRRLGLGSVLGYLAAGLADRSRSAWACSPTRTPSCSSPSSAW